MKKRVLLTACLLSACAWTANVDFVTAAKAEGNDFACQYAQTTSVGTYAAYGGTANLLTAEEAAAADIPAGYENEVLVVNGTSSSYSAGVLLDFSASALQVSMVESITFRVYVGADGAADGYPELRIVKPNTGALEWIMRYYLSNNGEENQWVDVTLDSSGTNFNAGNTLYALAKDGVLDKFELSVRVKKAKIPFYIDSVSVKMKENDGVAPVITYEGAEELSVFEGAAFSVNATAFDTQENEEKEIEYVWKNEKGEIVAAEKGRAPAQGEYTLLLRAVDYYGNVAEKSIRVTVKEADKNPPEIMLNAHTVYALTGTLPYLNIEVKDDSGDAETSFVWSQGALDNTGRLTEGTHTLTVRAEDASGNKTEKVVAVYVLPDEVEDDVVVDEEALTPDEPILPDDSEDSSVEDSSSDEPEISDDSSVEDSSSDEPEISDDGSGDDSGESIKSADNSANEGETPSKGCGNVLGDVGAAIALCCVAFAIKKKKE